MASVSSLEFLNSNYDEDLQVNPFLVALQENRKEVFFGAVRSNWLICVPRIGSFHTNEFNEDDFLSHVLVELDSKECKFKSLKNQTLTIKDQVIITGKGFDHDKQVAVLFDESFYLPEGKSFKVCCISEPLNRSPTDVNTSNLSDHFILDTIEDCTDLLWGHSGNETLHRKVDGLIHFHCHELEAIRSNDVQIYKEGFLQLHKRAFSEVIHDKIVKRIVRHNPNFQNHLKLAVEIYILDKIYRLLFHALTNITAKQDARLNKVTRNWHDIRSNKAGIKSEISTNIPRARRILSQITRQTFPIAKCNCLKKTVKSLVDIKHSLTSSEISESHVVTSDDVLSVLVFLIIKSDISNWYTHLLFAREFRFCRAQGDDEREFLLSTLEASLEYVCSLSSKVCEYDSLTTEQPAIESSREEKTPLLELFAMIEKGEVSAARNQLLRGHKVAFNIDYFSASTNQDSLSSSTFEHKQCDPLCQCDNCKPERKSLPHSLKRKSTLFGSELLSVRSLSNKQDCQNPQCGQEASFVTVYSKDERAWTALHVASLHGQMKLTTLILELGGEIDARDVQGRTPLHLACAQGHQDIIFLLLEAGANINTADSDGYRPIHIATERGHEMCVKTLLYFGAANSQLNVDSTDARGNTALHLAAKWGYEELVELLLECGASPIVRNHYDEFPSRVSNSQQLAMKLRLAAKRFNLMSQEHSFTSSSESNPSHCFSDQHKDAGPISEHAAVVDCGRRDSMPHVMSESRRPSVISQSNTGKKLHASLSDHRSMSSHHSKQLKSQLSDASCSSEVAIFDQVEKESYIFVDKKNYAEQTLSPIDHQIQKMLKAAADGDLQMVCHYLGINTEGEIDEDLEVVDMSKEMCHPLCQCSNCLPIQKLLISANSGSIHINSVSVNGFSALHIATIGGHVALVQFLINRGADLDLRTNNLGCAAVHFSALYNHLEILLYLLKAGVSIHSKDFQGNTPLHYAALKGHAATVATLIQQGGDVNSINNKGNTPLHESARKGHIRVTRFLLWNGANPLAKNKQHITPEYLAANPQVTQCIEKYLQNRKPSINHPHESAYSSWVVMHSQSMNNNSGSKNNRKNKGHSPTSTDVHNLSVNKNSDEATEKSFDNQSMSTSYPSMRRRDTVEVDAGTLLFDATPPNSMTAPRDNSDDDIQREHTSSYVLVHSTESDNPDGGQLQTTDTVVTLPALHVDPANL